MQRGAAGAGQPRDQQRAFERLLQAVGAIGLAPGAVEAARETVDQRPQGRFAPVAAETRLAVVAAEQEAQRGAIAAVAEIGEPGLRRGQLVQRIEGVGEAAGGQRAHVTAPRAARARSRSRATNFAPSTQTTIEITGETVGISSE